MTALVQLQELESERDRLETELEACLDKLHALSSKIRQDEDDAHHAPIQAEFLQAQSAQDLDRLMEVVAKAFSSELYPCSFVREVQDNDHVDRTIVCRGSTLCYALSNGDVYREGYEIFNMFHVTYAVIREQAKHGWSW